MTELAWPIATVAIAGLGARFAHQWFAIQDARRIRDEQRAERESGLLPKFEEVRDEMRAARVEMKTFLANNRGNRG